MMRKIFSSDCVNHIFCKLGYWKSTRGLQSLKNSHILLIPTRLIRNLKIEYNTRIAIQTYFDKIDETKFRKGLDIGKCKQFILWANIGFTNQLLGELRNNDINSVNSEIIIEKLDEYFDELRKVFYTLNNG